MFHNLIVGEVSATHRGGEISMHCYILFKTILGNLILMEKGVINEYNHTAC